MIKQHALEYAIYKCLTYGDEKPIAELAGKGASYYSQMFNPDDPRESLFYRSARDFVNWSKVNRCDAERAFAVFCAAVSDGMHETQDDLCHETETVKTLKETHDIVASKINGESLYQQLRQATEAEIQIKTLKASLLDAIHAEKSSFNGGKTRINGTKPVLTEVRDIGKEKVGEYRLKRGQG